MRGLRCPAAARQLFAQLETTRRIGSLQALPPQHDGDISHALLGAQFEQIEAGTEARMFEGAQGAPTSRHFQPRL
jgi:hypothetical protein